MTKYRSPPRDPITPLYRYARVIILFLNFVYYVTRFTVDFCVKYYLSYTNTFFFFIFGFIFRFASKRHRAFSFSSDNRIFRSGDISRVINLSFRRYFSNFFFFF